MTSYDDSITGRTLVSRRAMLGRVGLAGVGLALTPVPGWPAEWFRTEEIVIPFTDVPETFTGRRAGIETVPGQNLQAQDLRELRSWTTPVSDFFAVSHYGYPELTAAGYVLHVRGLVERPLQLTLDDLKRRRRVERTTVFECAGNSRAVFHGMVGNATWVGADLRAILEEAGVTVEGREVHFRAADSGVEEIRGAEYPQSFARSMSLAQIMERNPILAYEMNGEPLPVVHGFPVRLIVPGWYGVGQVKWLTDIEVSADRLMSRFMARDYVTIMGREVNGETEWVETSVSRQRVKSVIARVTRNEGRVSIFGAAWGNGAELKSVEVRIDDGDWLQARLEPGPDPHTWTFFTLVVENMPLGERTLVSRATDIRGETQPVELSMKRTRWENNELFTRTIQVS
jgi:DMSO/TMAO reductase YedYZ molybdopterin-dependent catalytic subunit